MVRTFLSCCFWSYRLLTPIRNGNGRGKATKPWSITTECPTARFYFGLFGIKEGREGGKMELVELEKITGKLNNPVCIFVFSY